MIFTVTISCLMTSNLPWFMDLKSRFLCNIVLCNIRLYFHHQSHAQLGIVLTLALFFLSGVISLFFSSSILRNLPWMAHLSKTRKGASWRSNNWKVGSIYTSKEGCGNIIYTESNESKKMTLFLMKLKYTCDSNSGYVYCLYLMFNSV